MYEPAYQQFLLIVIPVILIACYLAFHRERKNLVVLIVSILLVVLGIPHLFTIPAILSGGFFVGTDSFIFLLFLLLLGVFCIVFGVRGILSIVRG